MPLNLTNDRLWAGTEASLASLMEAQKLAAERMASMNDDGDEDKEQDLSHILSVENGIATIEVKGTLVNTNAWYNCYFGLVSYDEIRGAFIQAAENPEVQKILLYGSSGGGAVSGVEDTAKLIRLINDRIKPVVGYAETAASAMYWLMSAAGEIYAGKTSLVGSIGVLAVHKEYSEYFKAEGVGVTVVRAGKEKALANSNEKLSEKGKAQIQQLVDATYTVFVEHIAAMRGKSYDYADTNMADGKEFVGQGAVDVGLVDGITTYSELLTKLEESTIDQSQKFMDTRGGNSRGLSGSTDTIITGENEMPKGLTEQQVAALAAGGAVTAVAEAEGVATNAEATAAPTEANTEQNTEAQAAPVETTATTTAQDDGVVAFLKDQLKAKDEALLAANVEVAGLKAQVGAIEALCAVVASANDNMRIALGSSALGVVGSPNELLAAHKELSTSFKAKFQAGGVTAATSQADTTPNKAQITGIAQAQLAAVNRK